LAAFGVRMAIQIIVFTFVQKRLNEPEIAIYSTFFDIFSPVINGAIFLSNMWDKPGKHKWK
jgi:hypothetical protein